MEHTPFSTDALIHMQVGLIDPNVRISQVRFTPGENTLDS
jgi:hypothetical protein